jgi:hypothetical protein
LLLHRQVVIHREKGRLLNCCWDSLLHLDSPWAVKLRETPRVRPAGWSGRPSDFSEPLARTVRIPSSVELASSFIGLCCKRED